MSGVYSTSHSSSSSSNGHGTKRRRNDEVEQEFKVKMRWLNESFRGWVRDNLAANPYATWQEGCQDYRNLAQMLVTKFHTHGYLAACGTGDMGQLGLGPDIPCVKRPKLIESLKDRQFGCIAAGGMHNLAIDASDCSVWSWGTGDNETLGRDKKIAPEGEPNLIRGLPPRAIAIQVTAGDSHSAVLGLHGEVYCWGSFLDDDGKVWWRRSSAEDSFGKPQREPVLVKEVSGTANHGGATLLASGANHIFCLQGHGNVFSWGLGAHCELGRMVCDLKDDDKVYRKQDILEQHLTPSEVCYDDGQPVRNARFVGAGAHHGFIISAMRSRVFACGMNQYGQLGIPVDKDKPALDNMHAVEALQGKGIATVCGGEHHSLAIGSDGSVYSFGRADSRELGVEIEGDLAKPGAFRAEPTKLRLDPPARIKSGVCGSHICAIISEENNLYTWGFGENMQLGYPTNNDEDQPTPKLVQISKSDPSPLKVAAFSAGGQHSLCLLEE